MLRVTFLGTAAARPTVRRNVTALSVQREGESILIDCGEGTQRQMMRYGTGFSVNEVFFTHLHADHILGLPGLLRTMGLQGREEAMTVYGPPDSVATLRSVVSAGVERLPFPVHYEELVPDQPLDRGDYQILPFRAEHGRMALGYAILERERLGRFDVERARSLGIPEGPLFGRLHRGESIEVDGRTIAPDELVGPDRPGRRVVFSGDSAPSARTIEVAQGADLLIHEATFAEEEVVRARETNHSTARQAAEVARAAGVAGLVLTHISSRYSDDASVLVAEAREVFPETRVARDGMSIEIGFAAEE